MPDYRYDLSSQLWNAVLNDVPDELIVHAKIIMNQTVAHTCHGPPLDGRVLPAKFLRNLLRRLSDDLETPDKCSPERLVRHELLKLQTGALGDHVVCLHQYVAKVITRLEGHPALLPRFAGQ